MSKSRFAVVLCGGVLAVLVLGAPLSADHSWNEYHWARTTSSFTLTIVNSLTAEWDPYAARAEADWSQSRKLDMAENPSGSVADVDRRRCQGITGQVHICRPTATTSGWGSPESRSTRTVTSSPAT
jgi:hypothetical protein